jgi:hypothetical protein
MLSQGLGNEHWKAEQNNEEIVHNATTTPILLEASLCRATGVRSSIKETIDNLTKHKLVMNSKSAAYPA